MIDIVDRLREIANAETPDNCRLSFADIFDACRQAAAEIERLRAGGCARNQGLTQFCAEVADAVRAEREACHAAVVATISDHDEDTPGGWCAANAARHAASAIRARSTEDR